MCTFRGASRTLSAVLAGEISHFYMYFEVMKTFVHNIEWVHSLEVPGCHHYAERGRASDPREDGERGETCIVVVLQSFFQCSFRWNQYFSLPHKL
jgi:hypothetical protein